MAHPLWQQLATAAGRPLDGGQIGRLGQYLDLLLAANERMNLTRIVDRADAEVRHVADALTLLPLLPKGPHRLADVGSGGGVPGLPLAVARPDASVTLIESVGKKADFLREAAAELGLRNVAVFRGRAEDWPRQSRDRFNVVTCRAVASLPKLLTWCRPLVTGGGVLLAMKGPRLVEELKEAEPLLHRQNAVVEEILSAASDLNGHRTARVRWTNRNV